MSMHGQTLSFSAEVEGRSVVILVQNPTFLAQVVSEGMRLALETYNNHLWLSTFLQPPLSFPFPQIPFYHHPTWEMHLFNPFSRPTNMEPIIFLPSPGTGGCTNPVEQCWDKLDLLSYGAQQGKRESSQVVPNISTTTSQVNTLSSKSPPPSYSTKSKRKSRFAGSRICHSLDEGNTIRNNLTKGHKNSSIQRKIKKKKLILICPPNLSKSSIDIRALQNLEIGNFVVIMNSSLIMEGESKLMENTTPINRSMNLNSLEL
ncbi:hypothetical protein KY289_035614 [Solanum tuberosum]|nr:hypothetical protein KY289_035614 [Solanum tuberosum]